MSAARMTPLDVALEPQAYQPYFRDFASKGIVYELPADLRGIGHDHLPMFVDLTSP